MTQSELTEHRLKMLEQQAEGGRQVERDVDLLKVSMTRFETMLVEVRTESASRAEQLHTSLSRLHQRFDELSAQEHEERGARKERARLGRLFFSGVAAGTAIGMLIVGALALFVGS